MAADDGAGRVVAGRYTLRRLLGRGGMGTVWLASDAVLGRDVAVKEVTFPVSLSDEERRSLRERTFREARAAARFEHAHATTVHDVVEEDGRPWIVMEHVPSRSLAELVAERGPLPVEQAVRIGLDVLDALSAAHRAGIVHRDVKPGNVLVDENGRAWLTDFGIATSVGDQHLTQHGVVLGSPPYIAPERARGDEPGPPADLWAFGATLFTAVAGGPPFERTDAISTLLAVTSEEPPPVPGAPTLEPVLRALLQKDPVGRMTADQAVAALRQVLVQEGESQTVHRRPEEPTVERRAPQPAPPPPPPPPAPVAQPGAGRGDEVERIDLDELSAKAVAATRSVAGSAYRGARRAARRRSERSPQPEHPRQPARAAPSAPPEQGWRFKRRWVVVPLLVLVAVGVVVLGVAGLLFEVLLDAD